MPLELIADTHYRPSIVSCRDYLVREGASNIGLEVPYEWQGIAARRLPVYRKREPDVRFEFVSIAKINPENYQRASPGERLRMMWSVHEKSSPHLKLLQLLARTGLQFKFYCYDGDDERSQESTTLHRVISVELMKASTNPFFVVTPYHVDIYRRFAESLEYRDENSARRIKNNKRDSSHVVSGYLHAPFLHHLLGAETAIVVAEPIEYVNPEVELVLRLRQQSIDNPTASRLVRGQILFLKDVLYGNINIADGIPSDLATEHRLKTTAQLYEELFPNVKLK